jgi:hypothetical protein
MKISLDDVSVTTLSLFSEEENYKKAEQDSSNAIIRAQVLLIASLIVMNSDFLIMLIFSAQKNVNLF